MDFDKAAELGANVCLKVGLNAALPGSGSLLGVKDAAREFTEGNTTSGLINLGFAALDLATTGIMGVAKEAAVSTGRYAAQAVTKEAMRSYPEDVAKEALETLSKDLANGMPETVVHESLVDVTAITVTSAVGTLVKSAIASGGENVAERLSAASLDIALKKTIQMATVGRENKTFESPAAAAVREGADGILGEARQAVNCLTGVMAVTAGLLRLSQSMGNVSGHSVKGDKSYEI